MDSVTLDRIEKNGPEIIFHLDKQSMRFSSIDRLRQFPNRRKEQVVMRRMVQWVIGQVDGGTAPGTIQNKKFTLQDVLVEDA